MPVLIVPVLVIALVALLAVIAYYGSEQLGHILAQLIPRNIPLVGDRIHNAVDSFASKAAGAMRAYVEVKIAPFADLVKVPAAMLRVHLSTILATLTSLAHTSAAIIRNVIPAQIARVADALRADIQRTIAWVRADIAATAAALILDIARTDEFIKSSEAALGNALRGDIQRAIGYTTSLVATAATDLRGDMQRIIGYFDSRISDAVAALRGDIGRTDAALTATASALTSALHTAETTLAGRIEQAGADAIRVAETTVTADVLKPWAAAWPDITAAVTGLEGVIADDLPQLGDLIRSLPRDLPADLAAAAGVGVLVNSLVLRYLRDCGVPNCRNLSKIGRDLQALFAVVEGGSIFSLVGAAARDPEATADIVFDGLHSLLEGAARAAQDVVGAA